jgi:hypothetical protein
MAFISILDIDLIISLANCLFTLILLVLAYFQFTVLNATNNAQYLLNLSTSFFSKEALDLITLFKSDCIIFINNKNNPIFMVDKERICQIYQGRFWADREYYTSIEIDCILLNHLDNIGALVEKKIITVESAFQSFGWYINLLLDNSAIKEYLIWITNFEKNSYVFSKLLSLRAKF